MSDSVKPQSNGSAVSGGSFRARAASLKTNTALFQLVEDMAGSLDTVNDKLDLILDLLRNKLAR